MATPRNVCHRCRHKWKVKKGLARECPKCGSEMTGPTDPAGSLVLKLGVLAVLGFAAAWYLDLLPGQTQAIVDQTVEQVRDEVDARTGTGEDASSTGAPGEH